MGNLNRRNALQISCSSGGSSSLSSLQFVLCVADLQSVCVSRRRTLIPMDGGANVACRGGRGGIQSHFCKPDKRADKFNYYNVIRIDTYEQFMYVASCKYASSFYCNAWNHDMQLNLTILYNGVGFLLVFLVIPNGLIVGFLLYLN